MNVVGFQSDTETVDSRGDFEVDEDAKVLDNIEEAEVEIGGTWCANLRTELDEVDPQRNFEKQASVMKSIPKFLRGLFKNALKLALEDATAGDDVCCQGWKLLLMLPRMLLHRRPGEGSNMSLLVRGRRNAFFAFL